MFRSTHDSDRPSPEFQSPDKETLKPSEVIPLSVLELDLPAPGEGWPTYLTGRGVEVTLDDIGRAAISRADARQLFDEQREAEVRRRERAAQLERQAVERDQQRRAPLGQGVKIPAGMSYAEAVMQAELDSQTYQPGRRSLVEDLFDNSGITFHPIQHEADE
jgi:hypothetical protein